MTSIRQALQQAAESLQALPHGSPELEAAVLLCHLLDQPRSFLYAWPDKILTKRQVGSYQDLIERRLRAEPIAHITGMREFWSLALKVSPATLIPRPETELLVERALAHLEKIPSPMLADLGTGSGAIALALASERPDCRVQATDNSAEALRIARENTLNLGLSNVSLHPGSWLSALPADSRYDLILSNPPYIPEQAPHLNQGDLPHEPRCALIAGHDGLRDIRTITAQAGAHLKPGGWLLLEHGFDQGPAVRDLFRQGGFNAIRTYQDLAGHDRITEGRCS
ncbi:MAG: peptide chain release factor N(5)-glutamine methyltransferase [Pseudomonadota bacterium]